MSIAWNLPDVEPALQELDATDLAIALQAKARDIEHALDSCHRPAPPVDIANAITLAMIGIYHAVDHALINGVAVPEATIEALEIACQAGVTWMQTHPQTQPNLKLV